MADVHRININFTERAHAELREFAAQTGRTISDVIRDGLALACWFDREQTTGGRILVERDGRVREIVWL